jgi:hypothetical protein
MPYISGGDRGVTRKRDASDLRVHDAITSRVRALAEAAVNETIEYGFSSTALTAVRFSHRLDKA